MQSNEQKWQRFLPLYAWVLFGIAALSLMIYIIAVISPAFAAGFNGSVGAFVRRVLAALTSLLPFSLAEILIYSIPLILIAVGIYAWRRHCDTWGQMLRYLLSLVSVISILFSLFVFSFGTGYHTETLDRRMGLTVGAVTAEDLRQTAESLVAAIAVNAAEVTFREDGFSVMPYELDVMTEKLLEAYGAVCVDYPFIQSLNSRIKPVLASKAMSHTHITGVYTYYTGEANVNTHFPDYTLPFTAAHELAHQRGIARENEANFVAFLVSRAARDPYIRYCAYLNMYEYVANALYIADPEAYRAVSATLPETVKGELRAYAAFFAEFSDSAIADVSNAVNDTYLKLNGNEAGTASYGLVVELAVAYHRAQRLSQDRAE